MISIIIFSIIVFIFGFVVSGFLNSEEIKILNEEKNQLEDEINDLKSTHN